MTDLPPLPIVEADCPACGNPTLLMNVPHPVDGRLPMPGLPVNAVACCLEDCEAVYQPIPVGKPLDTE